MKLLFMMLLCISYISWSMNFDYESSQNKDAFLEQQKLLKADRDKIIKVIENESKAFWDKDFESWANYWAHEPYIRTMGWWARGGITVVNGWEERSARTEAHMKNNPIPNPQNVRRENINMRIYQDAAWVTFDQYGNDTGEPDMDMPGLSRETRFLEKHNGQWKIVYVGWLLEGEGN